MARSPRMEGYFSFDKGVVTETHILSGGEGSLMSMDNFDLSPKEGLSRRKGAVVRNENEVTLDMDNGNGGDTSIPHIHITGHRMLEVNNRLYGSEDPYERALAISTNIGTILLLVDRSKNPILEYLELSPKNLANKLDVGLTSITYSDVDGVTSTKGVIGTVAKMVRDSINEQYIKYDIPDDIVGVLKNKVSLNQMKGIMAHRYGDSVVSLDGVIVGTLGMGIGALLENLISFNYSSLLYRDFKIQSDVNSDAELSKNSDSIFIERIRSDLLNQGWTKSQINAYVNRFNRYPSLAMSPIDAYDTDDKGKEFWSAAMFDSNKYQRTSGEVARGSRVMKQCHGARSDKDSIDDDAGLYLTCSEVHGGRVWYAGHRNLVFYSKSLMPSPKIRDLATCHSINDPTSRYDNDPLPTDGGYVSIPGGGNFVCMRDFLGSLIVFGRNGVWAISGTDLSSVVDPQDINVSSLSSTGPTNQGSIVVGDNSIYYFTEGGIHVILPHQETGQPYVRNISSDVFDSYFKSIPETERATAMGSYSEEYNRVVWAMVGTRGIRIMNIDTRTGAMFPYSISNPNGYTKVIPFPDKSVKTEVINSTVMVGSDVVTAGLDEVEIPEGVDTITVELLHPFMYVGVREEPSESSIKLNMNLFTLDSESMLDWGSVEYLSFVETAYDTWDNPASHKEIDTMFVWVDNTIKETSQEPELSNLKLIDSFTIENYVQSMNSGKLPTMDTEGLSYGGLAASGDIVDE